MQDRQIICSLRLARSVTNSAVPRYLTSRLEYVIPLFLFAFLAALKVIYAFAFHIDSDETQHLHVVWGWANGLLPYPDFFDNHSPLFQFVCAPLFHALGERADIVIPMRLAMIPLYFFSLWCTYRCGVIRFFLLAAAASFGAALIPAWAVIFFALKGALPNLYYCVLQHNIMPGCFLFAPVKRMLALLPLAALALAAGYYSWHNTIDVSKRDRIAFLAVTSIVSCLFFGFLWPIVNRRIFCPSRPWFLSWSPARFSSCSNDSLGRDTCHSLSAS